MAVSGLGLYFRLLSSNAVFELDNVLLVVNNAVAALPDMNESPYTLPLIVTCPPCHPSPYESRSVSVCSFPAEMRKGEAQDPG